MARDGSGSYALPEAAFVYGDVIDESAVNNNFSDIASALSQSMSKDGQTTPTANQAMDSYKHTGVGNASARDQYAAAGQVQDSAFIECGDAGGTADALTLTPTPAITAYVRGQRFTGKATATNTGAATVAVSGLAAKAIQLDGSALAAGEITSGKYYSFYYDGTQFQVEQISYTPPVASTAEAEAGTNNTNVITPLRMREGFNASGTAPVYACRAWVKFNGTGTVAIGESGNVSSITDNGTGDYTVNFATAMPDANYSVGGSVSWNTASWGNTFALNAATYSTTAVRFTSTKGADGTANDALIANLQIFR